MLVKRSFLLIFACLVMISSTFAAPTVLVLKNKPNNNNFADCDGVYFISEHSINNAPVYIREDNKRFIGWQGNAWSLTSTYWLEEVLEEQGSFGGYHFSNNVHIERGWEEYETSIANYKQIHLVDRRYNHGLGPTLSPNGDIVNGKLVYEGEFVSFRFQMVWFQNKWRLVLQWDGVNNFNYGDCFDVGGFRCGSDTTLLSSWDDETSHRHGTSGWMNYHANGIN